LSPLLSFTRSESSNIALTTPDGLLLEYLPPYSPELNPLEQWWRQLKAKRANRLFRTLDDLKSFLTTVLPTLTTPRIYEYLC
jgi:transposase